MSPPRRTERLPLPPALRLLPLLLPLVVPPAGAHPLGNESVNHYAGIEIAPDRIRVKYLLDYAEIPSLAELERVDPDRDDRVGPDERKAYLAAKTDEVLSSLRLEVNGEPKPLTASWSNVAFPPGESGASTVRIAWELVAPLQPDSLLDRNFLLWSDRNHEDRFGWKEIRFEALDGLGIARSSVRDARTSRELSDYPEDLPGPPPNDTRAWCQFGPGLTPEEPPAGGPGPGAAAGGGPERSGPRGPWIVGGLLALLVAAAGAARLLRG